MMRRILCIFTVFFFIGGVFAMKFNPQRAFKPSAQYEPIPVPMPGDWLYEHPENGQTFNDFVNSNPNRPDGKRNKIYLQPLGDFRRWIK
jgi:uncharacterized membrane protein YkgB